MDRVIRFDPSDWRWLATKHEISSWNISALTCPMVLPNSCRITGRFPPMESITTAPLNFSFPWVMPTVEHWWNGVDANESIRVFVVNGRYSVMGGQGRTPLRIISSTWWVVPFGEFWQGWSPHLGRAIDHRDSPCLGSGGGEGCRGGKCCKGSGKTSVPLPRKWLSFINQHFTAQLNEKSSNIWSRRLALGHQAWCLAANRHPVPVEGNFNLPMATHHHLGQR